MKKRPSIFRRNQSQLAGDLGLSRTTILRYLSMPGAPERDRHWRYDRRAVAAFIAAQGSARLEGSRLHELMEQKLRLTLEMMMLDAAVQRGEMLPISTVEPLIRSALVQLTAQLQQTFENELPTKYRGRSTAEVKALNTAAIDRVLQSLAAALAPLQQ